MHGTFGVKKFYNKTWTKNSLRYDITHQSLCQQRVMLLLCNMIITISVLMLIREELNVLVVSTSALLHMC